MLGLSNNMMPFVWLALAVGLLIFEASTVQLMAIWFACGAVIAVFASLLGLPVTIQTGLFLVVSAVLLAVTRPLVKKLLGREHARTNADSNIGRLAVVTERVDNTASQGRILLEGLSWAARSSEGDVLEEGEEVLVVGIEGVKAIVQRI